MTSIQLCQSSSKDEYGLKLDRVLDGAVDPVTKLTFFLSFHLSAQISDVDIEAQFSINQSRADEITMREDYGSLPMTLHDDGFGDIGFDADGPDFIRDHVDPNIDVSIQHDLCIFCPNSVVI